MAVLLLERLAQDSYHAIAVNGVHQRGPVDIQQPLVTVQRRVVAE